jgi:CubicO group peptidase (beta-lactamase class C family)
MPQGNNSRGRFLSGAGAAAAAALLVLAGLLPLSIPAWAAAPPITPAQIDQTVSRAMEIFSVPGLAVGIVKDGELVFAKGYGVRELGQPAKVDPDTLFAIGSITKAFTTASLAMLVDEGKLGWDDRVIDHLPDFRLYDPYVTYEFTVRDLLTHRSGLGLGAGDLLFVPSTDFSREQVIHALRYLKPVSSFRSRYAYDNLLYVVAGQIIPAVTNMSWEDFVTQRILRPLHMEPCAVNAKSETDRSNVAARHAKVDGRVTVVPAEDFPVVGPAGTIQCNINGMAKWLETQLAGGKSPTGERLFSTAQRDEMWSPQTIIPNAAPPGPLTRTHFAAYGLGWRLEDYNGYKRVHHSGGVLGTVTYVNLIPELNLGVIVLTNQEDSAPMTAISLRIIDAYIGAPPTDWVAQLRILNEHRDQQAGEAENAALKSTATSASAAPPQQYVGVYHDLWRQDANIDTADGKLHLKFSHTERLEGDLTPDGPDRFIVRWADRSLHADAYVLFSRDFDGKVAGFTMRPVSPLTDFSYDFQDLDFRRRPK